MCSTATSPEPAPQLPCEVLAHSSEFCAKSPLVLEPSTMPALVHFSVMSKNEESRFYKMLLFLTYVYVKYGQID